MRRDQLLREVVKSVLRGNTDGALRGDRSSDHCKSLLR
jgi:hypothetical protein